MDLPLDRSRLDRIVQAIVDRLEGDWLLVGGALAALWFDSRRVTEDVDVVSLTSASGRLDLMSLATDLDLPLEAVNSAADFFVRRIQGWDEDIVLLRQGKRGRLFRPTATLFLLLKIPRLSEQDLRDCLGLLDVLESSDERLDFARVSRALDQLPSTDDGSARGRREHLRQALRALERDRRDDR